MKCFACKRELPEGGQFCSYCGENQGFEERTIEAARRGDQEAIADLYSRTYENVYHTVRALIRDEDTVLDLVQDTYVKAFENLDRLHDPNKFRAWVKRIGHNLAVDYTRRSKPLLFSQMTEEDSDRMLSFEDDRTENLPEVALDRRETSRLVREILDCLPEDQRLAVGMFYYEQRSVKDIAGELGISENTVKSRLYQARGKIESKVRALEAQGTRLYSLSPILFLQLLLRREESFVPAIPAEEILDAVSGELVRHGSAAATEAAGSSLGTHAGASAGRSAAHSAGRSVTRAVGRSAGQAAGSTVKAAGAAAAKGAAVKIAALVTAVAVAAGGGAYAVHEVVQSREQEPQTVQVIADSPASAGSPENAASPEGAAPIAGDELPEETRLALNQFLSSFSELHMFEKSPYNGLDGDGDRTEIRNRCIFYAFMTSKLHQRDSIFVEGSFYTIPLETVNQVLERSFGFRLSEAEAEDFGRTNSLRGHYSSGSFYFPGADGESYNRLSLVREMDQGGLNGQNTVTLRFDVYVLDPARYWEQGKISPDYYRLTTGQADQDPDLTKVCSGEAVLRIGERDGQLACQLLAYRILDEEEALVLDHTETISQGNMSVEYPVFRGKGAEQVNYKVYERALELCTIQYEEYPQDALSGEYHCAVTLLNDRILSMIFWGWSYIEGGIHPWTDLFPLNLDLQTLESFKLSQLYRMDDPGFAAVCYARGGYPGEPETCYPREYYDEAFAHERDQSHSLQFARDGFLKPEGVVVSGAADHFTGCDHIEVLVPWDALWDYYIGPYDQALLSSNRPERNGLEPALCEAYLRQLASRETDIRYFAGKNNASGVRNVAVADVTGDEVPELLYVTSQEGAGGAFLWIYTYVNGETVKLAQEIWEPEAGQEILRCVFRRKDDPSLYLLYAGAPAEGAWYTNVRRLTWRADGSLDSYTFASERHYASGHYPDYFFDVKAYNQEEYCKLLVEFYAETDQVLMYDLRDGLDGRLLSTVDDEVLMSPSCHAMHYDRAVAWLKAY